MRYVFVLCLLATVCLSGCDVKSIILAKDPMKVRADARIRERRLASQEDRVAPPVEENVRVQQVSAEVPNLTYRQRPVTPHEMAEIMALADYNKELMYSFDCEKMVDQLYPPLVEAAGGRAVMLRMLEAEKRSIESDGIVFESIEMTPPDEMHVGEYFCLCFIPSTTIMRVGEKRVRIDAYFYAFAGRGSKDWYLLYGSRMPPEIFHALLPGFPETLKCPETRKQLLSGGPFSPR